MRRIQYLLLLTLAPLPLHAEEDSPPAQWIIEWKSGLELNQKKSSKEELKIDAGGQSVYVKSTDGQAKEARYQISDRPLEALHRALRTNEFCALQSQGPSRAPEMSQQRLRVSFPDLDCEVKLWKHEWTENRRAKACKRALSKLISKVKSSKRTTGSL